MQRTVTALTLIAIVALGATLVAEARDGTIVETQQWVVQYKLHSGERWTDTQVHPTWEEAAARMNTLMLHPDTDLRNLLDAGEVHWVRIRSNTATRR